MISHRRILAFGCCLTIISLAGFSLAQRLPTNRHRGQEMLATIKDDLKNQYYDPNFRGIDIDARFKSASEKIKRANSNGQIYAIIAQALVELNDSHTLFLPPSWGVGVDYGFQIQIIGDTCYVVAVKSESDAAAKNLKAGDIIEAIDGYAPSRNNLWKILYSYYKLQPRDGMRLTVRDTHGILRELELKMRLLADKDVEAWWHNLALTQKPRYQDIANDLIICRLPHFKLTNEEVDKIAKRIKSYKTVIIDLRGNSGGHLSALNQLVGYFFASDIKIGDQKGRKGITPAVAKTQGANSYQGKLITLVDSESSSAAEIFVRVIQLGKRGAVIGDRTAGEVMAGITLVHRFNKGVDDGWATNYAYGISITISDFVMTDGQSLEHVGVTPDKLLLPTTDDLAAGRDPVLSYAAGLAGVVIDPDKAGRLFPRDPQTEVINELKSDIKEKY